MNIKGDIMLNKMGQSHSKLMGLMFFLFIFQIFSVRADGLTISNLDIATLAGDKLQIQFEMNDTAVQPKVFHTDNPARIALDFQGVKNGLKKKMYPINQGNTTSIYVAEATDKVRIVINLIEPTPFETKLVGNKVFLTLSRSNTTLPVLNAPAPKPEMPELRSSNSAIATLLPQQAISGFDFKRGEKGEGRILISLANPNTVVNTKEEAGKVIISFLNTQLTSNLAKRLDVSEFATPVKYIDTVSSNQETKITVQMQNNLYDYSLVQSEGLITVEFRPLSDEEKEAIERSRVQYTGDKLSLNFQEIEIRSVIAILAEFTGKNLVAGDDVTGTITLKLDDVPWDEALDFVMMTKELGKFETGNVTLISPLDKIKDYKKKQQETEAVVEQLDPLVTEYIKINYAKATDFRNLLLGLDASGIGSCVRLSAKDFISSSTQPQSAESGGANPLLSQGGGKGEGEGEGKDSEKKEEKFTLLSSRGSAVVDSRTNTLIVRETAKRLEEVKKLIRKLDVPVRQVMIESRIVIATDSFAKELGVKFGKSTLKDVAAVDTGKTGVGGQRVGESINDELVDLAAGSALASPYGALGMTLARGADYVLNLELTALQNNGLGEILANPRVMTSDRCLATIQQGAKIPYVSTKVSATTITNTTIFIDAVLQLGVLPQITPDGSITMGLYITKNTLGDPVDNTEGAARQIDKRELNTSVHVNDGETVVLGGIFEGSQQNTTNKVPFFADLPGIGFLFKRTINRDEKKELLIFVTPKIVKEGTLTN